MQHPETDIVFPGPLRGREEQNTSLHAPLMIGTGVSHNLRIPASEDNLVSCVQASGNGNMSSAMSA